MSHVLKGRLVLEMVRHHGDFRRSVGVTWGGSHVAFVVVLLFILIVKVLLPREVLGALVLMSAAILGFC